MKLSAIKQVKTSALKKNPLNEKYFDQVPGKELQRLTEDIKKHGIKVPLIAKTGGTIIAGHNRHLIALSIGLKTVPVQYIEDDLSEDEEVNFLVGDNLFRRQLTPYQRDSLYDKIVPAFKDRVMIKNDKSGVGINVKEVSRKTGVPESMVKDDIVRIRRNETRRISAAKEVVNYDESAVVRAQKNITLIVNTALRADKRTIEEIEKLFKTGHERIKTAMFNAGSRK